MMIWRFRRLLAAYGADPARWPAVERARADGLLARSAKARALLTEAQRLDSALRADVTAPADERLAAAILVRAMSAPQERAPAAPSREIRLGWSLASLWPQAVGLAAAAVLGFVLGWTDLLPSSFAGGETIDLADFLDAGMDDEGPLL